jgi:hypothetical protein
MATTNANKFGLRKAAEERRNRHAQRTPLPPRPGVVEAARMAVEASYSDTKSAAKAEAFGERCSQYGWQHEIQARGDVTELTATRGPETIVQAWRGGVWQWDASVYAFADRTTKPRNASGAAKLLERAAEDAAAETARVASNNSFRKRTPTDLAPIALPLDAELLTDEEAAKYFRGRTVKWFNRLSRSAETATVSRQSTVRVTRWEGETTVSFCCPVTGFRAFHLSAVLAVGRGKSGITAGSQTASVELTEEDAA